MARPLRIEYPNAFYHIIQRGIEKKDIFNSDADHERFIQYLDVAYIRYKAIFHSYILMQNHYHMILETPKANLCKIMHYLDASYAVYFNSKRERRGPLYQGRFNAILVEADEYLHYLSRYIHLNPVRIGVVKDPIEYRFSSYRYFVTKDNPPRWLNVNFILSIFNKNTSKSKQLYKQFVLSGIGQEKDIIKENIRGGFVLGHENFFTFVKERFIKDKEDPEIPILNSLRYEPSLTHIKNIVEANIEDNIRLRRKAGIYLSRKYTQKTLKQIAEFYGGMTDTGVSQVFIRTNRERNEDKSLNGLLAKIEKLVNVECGDLTPIIYK